MSVLCPNCSRYVADGKFCPFCGHDLRKHAEEASLTLKQGSLVGDRYVIGEVLGRGEFGVTYSGFDNQANNRVIIIEYLPEGSAKREAGSNMLLPVSAEQTGTFDSGKAEFLEDARGLTELGEGDYRARIQGCFEQNGTAYCVSDYLGAVDPGEYVPHAFYPEKIDAAAPAQPIPAVVEFGDRQPEPPENTPAVAPQADPYFIDSRKTPKKKPPLLWIGIGLAAAVIILVIALLAGGGKKDKKDTKPAASSSPKVTATAGKDDKTPADASEEQDDASVPEDEPVADVVSLAGSYKMTRYVIGGQDYTDDLTTFDLLNMRPTLEIDEDNVGTLDMFDEKQELRFDPEAMTVTSTEDDETVPFTLDNGVISFTLNASEMAFTPADRVDTDSGSSGSGSSGSSGSSDSAPDEDRAADAVSLSFGTARYNAGYWNCPALVPDTPIENCTGFTLCFRYDSVDESTLGQHRVYVSINLKGNAWLESNRMDIPEQGVVYRTDIRLDKARNVEGIALLPVKASEKSFRVTAWIENIQYA